MVPQVRIYKDENFSRLLNSWREGLSEDKIYPIISRLSAITLCLD